MTKRVKIRNWLDTGSVTGHSAEASLVESNAGLCVDWLRVIPFIGMHLACFAVVLVGWSPFAVGVAVFLYLIRMFAITGFYHRYFSHRTFKMSRFWQFAFAALGSSAVQRGPIWWASHHRRHHSEADKPGDIHSPKQRGFWFAHVGWFLTRAGFQTQARFVQDWMKYRELRWLDRFDILVPSVLALALFGLGKILEQTAPGLGTSGWQLLIWGFFISTVALYHGTYTINSLAHRWGKRRFPTPDESRNNFLLALLTLGEGWHNNHHFLPNSVRQGLYWWQVDFTFYVLKILSWIGIVRELKVIPHSAIQARIKRVTGEGSCV